MSDLEKLKKAIDKHFREEAKIVQAILEANLTPEEIEELREFVRNHDWIKQARSIFEALGISDKIAESLKKEIEEIFSNK